MQLHANNVTSERIVFYFFCIRVIALPRNGRHISEGVTAVFIKAGGIGEKRSVLQQAIVSAGEGVRFLTP